MNITKILQSSFVLVWLVGSAFFLGCTTNQETPPAQNGSKSTVQIEEAGQSPVEEETSVSVAEEISDPETEEPASTLILVADHVTTLDPYKMVGVHPDGSVASHIWDTLTLLNDDLQIEPHLAESWRLVNNFTWEITLRKEITFHNDEALDAEAVRFSIERAQSLPGSLETFAEDVGLEQVEVVDEYTLRVTTRQAVVNMPYHLAFLEILPPAYYSETNSNRLETSPVGSGPYELVEWTQGNGVILEAVSDYWKGPPILPRLIFKTVPNIEERLDAIQKGKASLVTDLPPINESQWDSSFSRLKAIESAQRMFIGIRIEEGTPLADSHVRQALNYGVNVEQIVNDFLGGYGERYGSWVNPPANNPELSSWPYDPDMARELLVEAGYGEGFTVTLRTPVGVYHHDADIAQAVAKQLGQIGITAEVDTVSNWGIYTHELLSGNTGTLYLLGLNSRGDAMEDIRNLSTDFAFNLTGWQNETFEEVLGRAAYTFNEASRKKQLDELQKIAYEESPWIWLWREYDFNGVDKDFDWAPRRDGLIYLYKPTILPPENSE